MKKTALVFVLIIVTSLTLECFAQNRGTTGGGLGRGNYRGTTGGGIGYDGTNPEDPDQFHAVMLKIGEYESCEVNPYQICSSRSRTVVGYAADGSTLVSYVFKTASSGVFRFLIRSHEGRWDVIDVEPVRIELSRSQQSPSSNPSPEG